MAKRSGDRYAGTRRQSSPADARFATANADGTFDSDFWIPEREPGLYTVTATDGRGHVGTTTPRVMAVRYPR
jgi:hypothetical protein